MRFTILLDLLTLVLLVNINKSSADDDDEESEYFVLMFANLLFIQWIK